MLVNENWKKIVNINIKYLRRNINYIKRIRYKTYHMYETVSPKNIHLILK